MTQETWAALGTGLGALVVAVLAYVTAQVTTNTAAVKAHGKVLSGLTRVAGTRTEGGAAGGGGGVAARHAPAWNQLADPDPSGQLPAQRMNDCGEECCAEVIYQQHGVEVEADYLRFQLGGGQRSGITSAADLVRVLARNNVSAAGAALDAAGAWLVLQTAAQKGAPVIALGEWVSPGVLHWILVTAATTAVATANDPWGGRVRTWPREQWAQQYRGTVVTITRAPDAV